MHQLLSVNSADSSSGTDASYVLNLPSAACLYKPKRIRLRQVIMPISLYNVRSTNNTIDFKDTGGTTRSVTITPGAYNATSLCSAVLTALNSVGPADFTTVTYSATTMKITISNSGSFSLLFGSGTNVATSIGPTLGYAVADTASATSAVADNVLQLYHPESLFISIFEFGTPGVNSKGKKYTFSMLVNTNPQGVQEIDNNQDYDQYVDINQNSITTLSVNLCYRDGTVVAMNGGHWEMVLEVIY